jgi:hypothetical protein
MRRHQNDRARDPPPAHAPITSRNKARSGFVSILPSVVVSLAIGAKTFSSLAKSSYLLYKLPYVQIIMYVSAPLIPGYSLLCTKMEYV